MLGRGTGSPHPGLGIGPRRLAPSAPRALAIPRLLALAALCVLALGGCGNTLQDQAVAPGALEPLVIQAEFPVYWLGGVFHRLAITSVARNPSGAYEIQYGNCSPGGENVCVTPLQVVTSPDNSFRPAGAVAHRIVPVRGVAALVAQGGDTIELATGGVVVDVYADSPTLAQAAAKTMVTINATDLPGAPLPAALPDTGFATKPLPSQQPPVMPARLGP
jgi:hypothetical protein